ncbi:MAG: CoA pyrophosphatase [Chitinophagales bacterium]|nr:CoA pyrophosphatase [Chitinophagales bacterium]
MFQELTKALEKQLSKPLPGAMAQGKMRPFLPGFPNIDIPPSPFAKESAVLALLYPIQDQPHILLIERNIYKGAHSGQISLPGGKLEKNESYTEAAVRETLEEVGVDKGCFHVIGELSKVFVAASNFNIQPIVAIADCPIITHPDSREVAQILETPFQLFFEQNSRKEKLIKSTMGMELMAPYFDVHNKTLWGATAMILSELIEVTQLSPQNILKY